MLEALCTCEFGCRVSGRYQDEVSDPKHRAETEAYLTQVEAEARAEKRDKAGAGGAGLDVSQLSTGPAAGLSAPEVPSGSELLKPLKGFVLKSWKREAGRKEFDRTMGKVFINVCAHADIQKPTAETVTGPDGRQGQSW
eukprot:6189316-Pleurochrysis_carterae.AAC.3